MELRKGLNYKNLNIKKKSTLSISKYNITKRFFYNIFLFQDYVKFNSAQSFLQGCYNFFKIINISVIRHI